MAFSIVHARLDDPAVAALALYRGVGFEPIPCWAPYATDPRSRCFELALRP